MSEFPKGKATDLTEQIMAAIREHLIDDKGMNHHYNRTYEKVWKILSESK